MKIIVELILEYTMQFLIGLIILQQKKVVLQIVLIIIFQVSELIHIILYLLKKFTLHVIIVIKSVFNKDKNNHYHNIFLEKGSYK